MYLVIIYLLISCTLAIAAVFEQCAKKQGVDRDGEGAGLFILLSLIWALPVNLVWGLLRRTIFKLFNSKWVEAAAMKLWQLSDWLLNA